MTKQEKWQEIANRGLQDQFDPNTRAKFNEAVKRGLIVMPNSESSGKSMLEKGMNMITPMPLGKMIDAYTTTEQKAAQTQMYKNLPGSAWNLANGVYEAATHPIDTAESFQGLGQGAFEKLAIPNEINGVDFGETQNTQNLNAVGSAMKDRYWGIDNIRNTAVNDPAGMLLDLSAAGSLAKTAGILGMKGVAKSIPETMPKNMMDDALVMRPTINRFNKDNKRDIVKTIVDEQIDPTSTKGADKAYANINELNADIESKIASVPKAVVTKKAEILSGVQEVRDQFTGVTFKGKRNKQVIDKALNDFDDHLAAIKRTDDFTVQEVQALKKDLYKELEDAFKKADFSGAETELMRNIANKAKESIEKIAPGTKEVNARLGKHYQMMEELPASINKMENYRGAGQDLFNKTGVGTALGTTIGSSIGGFPGAAVGGAIGSIGGITSGILSHPRVRARNALLLDRLRKSGSYTDQLLKQQKLPLATQGLLYSGQIN